MGGGRDDVEDEPNAPIQGKIVWQDHVALIAGVAASLLVAERFLAIAGWDTTTAVGALQALGPTTALLGTVIAAGMTIFVAVSGGLLGVLIYLRLREGRRLNLYLWATAWLLTTIAVVFTPTGVAVLAALLPLGGLLFGLSDRNEAPNQGTDMANRTAIQGVLFGVLLGSFVLNSTPWLPREAIRFGHDPAFVGYVLRDDGDRAVVLLDEKDTIRYLNGSISRRICYSNDWATRSLAQLLFATDDKYPACSKLVPEQ